MSYHVPDLSYLTLRVEMTAEEKALLPPIKGSMLRGAFGHALRRTVCAANHATECKTCLLKSACIYTQVFETFIQGQPPPFLRGLPTPPRPFVFDVTDDQTEYDPGDSLVFHFTLLGTATQFYPHAVYSLIRMGLTGLTRRRHRFAIEQIKALKTPDRLADPDKAWQPIYDPSDQTLEADVQPLWLRENGTLPTPLTLDFITPTRIKVHNTLVIDFTFRQLTFKLIRRALEIAHFYQPDAEIDWEFNPVLKAADRVDVRDRHLSWVDWQRHSNRQKTDMKLGGFTGHLVLDGDLSPLSHLLNLSTVLHVGKGATFGLGKMEIKN